MKNYINFEYITKYNLSGCRMEKGLLTVFFILPCLVFGQDRYADSLAVHRYESQYQSTIYGEKAKASAALDSLGHIMKQRHYPEAAFYYHFLSGDYYFNTQQLQRSRRHYREALRVAVRLGMNDMTVQTKIWLGNLAFFGQQYTEANRWHTEAYTLAEEIDYNEGMCNALFALADLQKDYYQRLEMYIRIEALYLQHNEISPVLANTYERMANLYLKTLNDHETAMVYFEKAISIARQTDYSYGVNEFNKELGILALDNGDFERAKAFFDDLYAENLRRNDTLNQMYALSLLADVDLGLKNYQEAEKKVSRAIAYFKIKNDRPGLTESRLLLARIYLGMQQPDWSKTHLDYARSHYKNSEDTLGFKVNLLTTEVDYYRGLRQYEKALERQQVLDSVKTYQNRLFSERQFLALETQYRTRQKEAQVELLSAENQLAEQKRQNQFRLFAAITLLLGVTGLALLFAYRNKLRTAHRIKEQNAMKSRFFANISHEFRTPLTLIKSPLQSLQAELLDNHQRKQLALMDKSADRMLVLVDQLLELSKLDSGKWELQFGDGNVGLFLESVTEPFAYQATEKEFIYTSAIEVCEESHRFDKDVVEKIVTNLLSNSLKYTPEKQYINFTSTIVNNRLNIHVSNTVQDMRKSDLTKFFERFYQNRTAHDGFGVGLALVKELVELYRGKIHVSLADNTLHFEVVLPLMLPEHAAVPTVEDQRNRWQHGETDDKGEAYRQALMVDDELQVLLIVDDNADVRNLLKNIFMADYTVLEAEDGAAALAVAQKEIPDCIISDVMMPEMDGFEFTKRIKDNELTSFIPVVMLTAKSTEDTHLESLECTADAFLTKPFHNEILKETVARQITGRKRLRERYSRELVLKPVDIAINTVDEQFLEKIGKVMEERLPDANFSTDDFAAELGMSRMQLHRKLKSLLNMSTTEFIRNERLKSAVALMERGHDSVSEVAYAVGFNDVSYFSKCFKELYGVTPTAYIDEVCDQSVAR